MELQKEIGITIKEIRRQHGISQEDLANKADIQRTYMGAIERGEKNITVRSLIKITKALNISLVDFFKNVENQKYLHTLARR